jgi:hypothetical protein
MTAADFVATAVPARIDGMDSLVAFEPKLRQCLTRSAFRGPIGPCIIRIAVVAQQCSRRLLRGDAGMQAGAQSGLPG